MFYIMKLNCQDIIVLKGICLSYRRCKRIAFVQLKNRNLPNVTVSAISDSIYLRWKTCMIASKLEKKRLFSVLENLIGCKSLIHKWVPILYNVVLGDIFVNCNISFESQKNHHIYISFKLLLLNSWKQLQGIPI